MDDVYLIEIRLARTKWRIRETIIYFGRLFSLEPYLEQHPHVTLFGPLTLNEGISRRPWQPDTIPSHSSLMAGKYGRECMVV